MATGYWKGANNGTWSVTTNWAANLDATGTISVVPGAGETAFFNANGTTTARNVYLNNSRSVGGITLNSNNGGTSIYGGTSGAPTTQSLTIGTGGITLDVNGLAFQSTANIILGTNQTWSNNSNLTVLSQVSGTGSLIKTGSGVLFLTNATGNSYSGGTTLSQSMIQVGSNTALGTGSVTINAGILCSDGTTARSFTNALSLNGTMTLGNATNTGALTFSGTTTIGPNPTTLTTASQVALTGALVLNAALTKQGTNNLVLLGSVGTGTGAVLHSAGTLWLAEYNSGTPNQLNGSSSLTLNSTTQIRGNTTYSFPSGQVFAGTGEVYLRNTSAGGLVFAQNTGNFTYSGSFRMYADSQDGTTPTQKVTLTKADQFSFSDAFFYSGSGLSSLSQTLSYTGPVATNTKALYLQPGSAGGVTATYSNDSATNETLTHSNIIQHNVNTIPATFRLAANSGALNVSGNILQPLSGILTLVKIGTYASTLSGDNTFTGTVSVSAGTLNANSATALGAASSTAAISVSSGATLSAGAALNYSSPGRTTTISGTGVATNGALVLAFVGTANLGTINLGATTYIRGTASGTSTLSSPVANGGFILAVGSQLSNGTLSLTGGISGLGGLQVSSVDAGIVALPTTNTYQGNTSLLGGTLLVGNATSLGTVGTLNFGGGAIDASTTLTLANALSLTGNIVFGGTAALTLSSNIALPGNRIITTNGSGGALTLSGIVSGTGFKLTKAGTNTLRLTAANTHSGGTDINAGTVQAGNVQALGTTGTVTLGASGTLQTLTAGGQNGKLTVASLNNAAGSTIRIGG